MIHNPKKRNLQFSREFKKYFANTGWLYLDKMFKFCIGFSVFVYLTRYLGPYNFGILTYSQTIIGIFVAISTLDLTNGGIFLRHLVDGKKDISVLLGTITLLTLITSILSIITIFICFFSMKYESAHTIIYILSFSIIFQNLNLIFIDYFQSIVQSKYTMFAGAISLIISSLIKLYLIYINASLNTIAIAILFDSIFLAITLFFFYYKYKKTIGLWSFDFLILKEFIKSAIPLTLVAISSFIYTRIDQLMIKNMLSIESVGHYSAAVYLSEIFYIIPTIITFSVFTKVAELKKDNNIEYKNIFLKIYSLLVWIAIPATILTILFGNQIIYILYGDDFIKSVNVLKILSLGFIFISINLLFVKFLYVEGFEKKYLSRTIFGVMINILLNYLLISNYGINGAALATVITLFILCYVYDFADAELIKSYYLKIKCLDPRVIFKT